jgi:hypothetical protein
MLCAATIASEKGKTMEDGRSSRRKPTILEGRIWLGDRTLDARCTVRNVSETGAQLWFSTVTSLPTEFNLDIPKTEQSHRARLMWSKGKNHGIMFVDKQAACTTDGNGINLASPIIQKILSEASRQLSQTLGIASDRVKLKLEIAPR